MIYLVVIKGDILSLINPQMYLLKNVFCVLSDSPYSARFMPKM